MPENTNTTITLQSTPESVQAVESLLAQIASPGETRQAASEEETQNSRMDAALAIRALLEPRIQKRKKQARFRWLYVLSPICSLVLSECIHLIYHHLPDDMKLWALLTSLSIGGVVAVGSFRRILDSIMGPKSQIQALLKVEDKRMIPLLLDVRQLVDEGEIGTEINKALAHLLPTLQASDAALLAAEHRNQLNQSLAFASRGWVGLMADSNFIVAILKALQQIGDHTSLPQVERLARSSRDPRIREAAEECLPFLKQRATLQGQTLLHPSSRPEPNADLLLRPAGSGVASEQDRLLRASSAEKTSR